MSAAILERQHFTVNQDSRYFRPDTLSKMIGQESNQWRHAALKELVDNALDAAESVYPAIMPIIDIEFTETENGLILSVADNGPGISAEVIPHIADFGSNSSTKLFYRAPLRGAQGNAIKTLLGMPVALRQEQGQMEIETQGQRHTLKAWLTVTGPKLDIQQTAIDSQGTRITVMIPGPVECYYWEPRRWITAYGLFNPHAQLQIRKIDPVFRENSENDEGQHGIRQFSDLSLTPTVGFPDPWRKFLPTDHTPAHWYSAAEFRDLVIAKADKLSSQPLGDFVQEFKGLSRVWRKVLSGVAVKTLAELVAMPDTINALHLAMQEHATAPKPEVLGKVGRDHFRQRFDDLFLIAQSKGKDRYWYRHRAGIDNGMPYLIEVAIAETERPGGVFYGLNYSVPFSDPLSTTHLFYDGGPERLESEGLHGLLREAGALSGERYGKPINTTAAVHLVMPVLPTLDLGKARLAISKSLAAIIAETVGLAAKDLHKEIIDWRQHQQKRQQQQQARLVGDWQQRQKEQERRARELSDEQDKEKREKDRQERRARLEKEAEERRLRGELPTKQDVVFQLMLPTYMEITEQEQIRIALRDFWYVLHPQYKMINVRPSVKDDIESENLDYGHFASLVATYRSHQHPMGMIDYKARATLYEGHSKREIAFGDRELRTYTLPCHEYAGILFIEKQCVWPSLRDTGIDDLADRYDLMIIISEGYATEAVRRLLAQAQKSGMQIMAWHDADPAGYNICRVLGEPTERMPDHHLDIIDIGLTLDEGLAMGLQTETFTRKNAIPDGILKGLTDNEKKLFTGDHYEIPIDEKKKKFRHEWRNCQRIEINAIKIRERVPYLERKISEVMARKAQPAQPGESPQSVRPPLADILNTAKAMIQRTLQAAARERIEQRIDLQKIEAAALATLPQYDLTTELEAALSADTQTPWREIVKQTAAERLNADPSLPDAINRAVDNAIGQVVCGEVAS